MLPYPDRFRFKSAPPRASRLMLFWFVFLLLVAVLSVGMLVTALVQAAGLDTSQDVRPHDATRGTLLFKTASTGHYLPSPLLKSDAQMTLSGLIVRATVRDQLMLIMCYPFDAMVPGGPLRYVVTAESSIRGD